MVPKNVRSLVVAALVACLVASVAALIASLFVPTIGDVERIAGLVLMFTGLLMHSPLQWGAGKGEE